MAQSKSGWLEALSFPSLSLRSPPFAILIPGLGPVLAAAPLGLVSGNSRFENASAAGLGSEVKGPPWA